VIVAIALFAMVLAMVVILLLLANLMGDRAMLRPRG
jgi:hypothetical protein